MTDARDWQSVFLISMLNNFAEKTEHGIIDFDTYASAPDKYDGWLIYDKSNMKVVDGTLVEELHCDIVGYYDFFSGVEIRVCSDEMDESALWVEVDFGRASIVVENGCWYVSEFPELRITAFDSETLLILSEPSKQIIVVFAVRI